MCACVQICILNNKLLFGAAVNLPKIHFELIYAKYWRANCRVCVCVWDFCGEFIDTVINYKENECEWMNTCWMKWACVRACIRIDECYVCKTKYNMHQFTHLVGFDVFLFRFQMNSICAFCVNKSFEMHSFLSLLSLGWIGGSHYIYERKKNS